MSTQPDTKGPASQATDSPKNRRRIILINRPFQIRFAIYVCLWLGALCFIYPLVVKNLFDFFVRYAAHDPMGPEVEYLLRTRQDVLTLLALTEVAFLAMTFLMCIFISHRIAGPLFKLRLTFDELANGTMDRDLKFREKDYFPELAEDFNRMATRIRDRQSTEQDAVAEAISRIEAALKPGAAVATELEPALTALRKVQDRKPGAQLQA